MPDLQNTLHQITHMYFDLTIPEGLKITLRYDKKRKLREEQEREDT